LDFNGRARVLDIHGHRHRPKTGHSAGAPVGRRPFGASLWVVAADFNKSVPMFGRIFA
jgi:hypothetical protein